MTKIYLVRHGQTEWNVGGRFQGHSDVELAETGIRQAECLAEHFPAEKIDAIYSSDLQRAVSTAEFLAERFGCEVQKTENLREMNFGAWEGLTFEQIVEKWPEAGEQIFSAPDELKPPGGETFQDVEERAARTLEKITSEHEGQRIILVAHGAFLRTILTYALHMPLRYVWRLRQGNTAVSRLTHGGHHFTVDYVNSIAHLEHLKGA
ncbi:alpha-ribazole phosphatase [Selenomonas sputigena]|uniref:Alpha-ribazole phosphatase n=1 Tax=Selenomonas sputigena TaxID=69823 RepID=A0ABV3X3L7_9FIRM